MSDEFIESELGRAAVKLDERKHAVLGDDIPNEGVFVDFAGEMRRLYVGFELAPEDLRELSTRAFDAATDMIAAHGPTSVPNVFAGMFCDGIAIGLLLAEQRQREEAQS